MVLKVKNDFSFFFTKRHNYIMAASSSPIYLGLAVELKPEKLYTLERHYLPLGKIGGFPAWLNPRTIPQNEELKCPVCGKIMAFLLQIYCTNPAESVDYAFHRVLYMFVCRNGSCSKTNDASNVALFRCNLPKQNAYYSPVKALNPEVVGDVRDPFFSADTYAKLCVVCGCRADKRCAKCTKQNYCSREHQIIDWNVNHKEECTNTDQREYSLLSSAEKASLKNKHGFTFREYGMEIIVAQNRTVDDVLSSEEDSDESDDDEENGCKTKNVPFDQRLRQQKLKELEQKLAAQANAISIDGILEEGEDKKDETFKQFHQWIRREPEQVLRYQRDGTPLLATDYSPSPQSVPNCALCGEPREFEFQVMPHLLALIDVDAVGQSLDWATLLVYTCRSNCPIPAEGYAREWVFKQDFVSPSEEEVMEK